MKWIVCSARIRTSLTLGLVLFGFGCVTACKDGSDPADTVGGESGETGAGETGENTDLSGGCGDATQTVLEDGSATPPGFEASVDEIVAGVEGQFAGTFSWYAGEAGWMVAHAGTSSALTAGLAYAGGTVTLVEVADAGMPPNGELGGDGVCANSLIVDMVLEFVTEDGVFAESMIVPVRIPGPDAETSPSYDQSLDLDAMLGTLDAADFVADEGMITDVVLFGDIGETGLTGDLAMEVMIGAGNDGIVAFGLIAEYDAPAVP